MIHPMHHIKKTCVQHVQPHLVFIVLCTRVLRSDIPYTICIPRSTSFLYATLERLQEANDKAIRRIDNVYGSQSVKYVTVHKKTNHIAAKMIFELRRPLPNTAVKAIITKYGRSAPPGENLKSIAPVVFEI